MSSRARRHIAVRQRGGDTHYALRFSAGGRRYNLALGNESDGWNRNLADRTLLAFSYGFQAGHLSAANGLSKRSRG
jgi:hypothetical protein